MGTGSLAWRRKAECKLRRLPPELFFPESAKQLPDEAAEACNVCAVRNQCLAHALEIGAEGVWGGMSETDREKLAREHKRDGTLANLIRWLRD